MIVWRFDHVRICKNCTDINCNGCGARGCHISIYLCHFQSFLCAASCDADIGQNAHDDRRHTSAGDAFDEAGAVMPMMRLDVASSILIFSSSAIHYLCLYFLMTLQSLERAHVNRNNMDRLFNNNNEKKKKKTII